MNINKFSKGKNGMYTITLEDNTKLTVHEDLILKYDLLLTKKLDDTLKEEIIEENKVYEIYEVSISYINKKLRSKKELSKYLIKKGYSQDLVDKVIELLYTQGYLNDKVYATSYVHDRIALSSDGPNKIRKDLNDLGIDPELIEESISSYTTDIEKERIEKLVSKQIKSNSNKGASLLKKKIQMNLLNLGYNYELINENLNSKNLSNPDIYQKEYNKIYKSLSKKYSGCELEYHVKQKLYQKGFTIEE